MDTSRKRFAEKLTTQSEDKFIPLKDEDVNVLLKLKKDSTFSELKKIAEIKKILDTIKEIYKTKISLKSLRYLNIISKVRKFKINAFKSLAEVKKLLDKATKEKLKPKRGRVVKGKASRDIIDKAIPSPNKKEDPLGKLLKDIIKSKDTSDLEKAIKDYANIFCQSGIQNLIKTNSVGKVFTDLFTVIKRNVNNLVFQGKIGFDNSGWNASKEFMNILTTAMTCLTQIKPVFDFFKNLFRRAFRVVTAPFRRGDRPPNPTGGRGDGPDDDDQPPPSQQPPSSQQRNRLNELLNQQQSNIESNIGSASSTFGPTPTGTTSGGPSQGSPPTGTTSGGPGTASRGDDLPSGGPSDESGAGAIAIQFGGNSQPRRNQFGAGIPSGDTENTPWDPFNFAAAAAYLAGMNTYFNPPRKEADIEAPESSIATAGGYISFNPPPEPQGNMDLAPVPEYPRRDDGLGFEDDFEREKFEMDEAERARQEAEEEDEDMDRKLPAIEAPETSVALAGSLFTGGKSIMASGFDAVRYAQMASKVFTQIAGGLNQAETISESVRLKEAFTNQQVIEGDIQNNLINQMVSTPTDTLKENLLLIEELVEEGLITVDLVEQGERPADEAKELLNDILDLINNLLEEIPKEDSDRPEVARLKALRAIMLNSIRNITDASQKVTEKFEAEYAKLLKGYEAGLTLGSLQRQILPNVQERSIRVQKFDEMMVPRGGRGQPKKEFNKFFGYTMGGPEALNGPMRRIFREVFNDEEAALGILREFNAQFRTNPLLSDEAGKNLNTLGRDYIMQLIKNYVNDNK